MILACMKGLVTALEVTESVASLGVLIVQGALNLPRHAILNEDDLPKVTFGPYRGFGDHEGGAWAFSCNASGEGSPMWHDHTALVYSQREALTWIKRQEAVRQIHPGDARYLRALVRLSELPYLPT